MNSGKLLSTLAILPFMATVAMADDPDPAVGEKDFKRCKACHMIVGPDDEVIMKGGKTGPNLYGVIGRTIGTYEGFKYGASLLAAGEAGMVWDQESLAEFITNPKDWLMEALGEDKVKVKMTYKHKKKAAEMAAFLALHGAVEAEEEAAEGTESN